MINGAFNNDLPSVFFSATFFAKRWINSSQFHKFRTPKSVASAEHSLALVLHNYPVIIIAAFCSSHVPTHSVFEAYYLQKNLREDGKQAELHVCNQVDRELLWVVFIFYPEIERLKYVDVKVRNVKQLNFTNNTGQHIFYFLIKLGVLM